MNFEEASYPAQNVDDYTHTRVCTYMCSQMHNTIGENTKQLLMIEDDSQTQVWPF